MLVLGEVADALADFDGLLMRVVTEDEGGALSGTLQTHEGADKGGLARAVPAKQGEGLAGLEGEIHALEHRCLAVGEVEVVDRDGGWVAHCVRSRVKIEK